ncbi:hypothetical protein EJB05_23177, partial [Eragrostis curvula]
MEGRFAGVGRCEEQAVTRDDGLADSASRRAGEGRLHTKCLMECVGGGRGEYDMWGPFTQSAGLALKQISQEIDSKSMTVVNASTLSTPFASFSFSATASFEVQSPSRIEVRSTKSRSLPP